MPNRKQNTDRVWAVWVSSPAQSRSLVDLSGPQSWWWIRWQWRGLFGNEESDWWLIRVRRWDRLGVWIIYPEGADAFRLDPWTLDAKGPLWTLIRYGETSHVRKIDRKRVALTSLVDPTRTHRWILDPGNTT